MNVCYPTRVGHPGTVLEGRYFNNYCDEGQDMCSPWTPPASSFPVVGVDRRDYSNQPPFALAARGCAYPLFLSEDADFDPEDFVFINSDGGGYASCDGVPFLGAKLSDLVCSSSSDSDPDLNNYVSNSYVLYSEIEESVSQDSCSCLWCPPEPPSGFSGFPDVGGDYNYGEDFDSEDFCTGR